MMGERTVMQEALFYAFSVERHVPADHLLRSMRRASSAGEERRRREMAFSSDRRQRASGRSHPVRGAGCDVHRTRADLSSFFGKEISRDLIGHLRGAGMIASGPRSPTPGAPYTYVTTKEFLLEFGLDTLRDLPDFEALEDAGLLSKEKLLAGDIPSGLVREAADEPDGDVVQDEAL